MRTTIALLLAFLSLPLRAQTPQLVKDINTIRTANPTSARPHDFFRYGTRTVFVANTPYSGEELWITDGTAAGTSRLTNLNPFNGPPLPSRFAIVNGTLLFNVRDHRGEELWRSDGTAAGTHLLADIGGAASSSPGDRIVFRDRMLFSAYDPAIGEELWITDGTPDGTRLLRDLLGSEPSKPHSFVQFGEAVYFVAGGGLWKTDGTEAGTEVVHPAPIHMTDLVVAGSRLFFTAATPQSGPEPWVSDGTRTGTRMIEDIAPGSQGSLESPMTAFGDRVLFPANDGQHGIELWISNGTPAGTRMVRDISPGGGSGMEYTAIAVIGGTAYFSATSPELGRELWKSDGTEGGTLLVRDLRPGPDSSQPFGLTVAGNSVFFGASGDGKAAVLWGTDGTAGGTRVVSTTPVHDSPAHINGLLWFAGSNLLNGAELWKSDGTSAGTAMVANVGPDPAPSSNPDHLTATGKWLYFSAWEGLDAPSPDSRSLWRTDGTPEGTIRLTDAPKGHYVSAGDSLFFYKNDLLWKSDGTPETTARALEFASRFPAPPSVLLALGDRILATVVGELYATTLAAAAPVIPLGPDGYLNQYGGRSLFFEQKIFEASLRITDGTPGGTYKIVTFPDLPNPQIVSAGGYAYFTTKTFNNNGTVKLWRTDGTHDGTVVVRTLPASPYNMLAAGAKVFFIIGEQLWASDGTEAGTRSLAEPLFLAFPTFAAAGDRVIFTAFSASSGQEPWVSDGTVEGTHVLADISPGPFNSNPTEFASIGGKVYMSAFDLGHGGEVWVTDGTTEGTRLAADVEPGTNNSLPRDFVRAGERLYFVATTTASGEELWSLPLDPHLSVQDIHVAEGDTTARFTVTLSAPLTTTVTVEYATADRTAVAGSDYVAASGTLTFNAGETSKSIDVAVRGDTVTEGNENFALTVQNAGTAFAIIEDNDRTADLGLSLDFSMLDSGTVRILAANQGPYTATNIGLLATKTPSGGASSPAAAIPDLAPGGAAAVVTGQWSGQQYFTATANAREGDPDPSNNRVAWRVNPPVAMDALYLTPGSQANVWTTAAFGVTAMSLESSNPAVVSVPSAVGIPAGQKVVSFAARGMSPGRATIHIFTAAGMWGTLEVDVVAPGTNVRWPGGITVQQSELAMSFERQARVYVFSSATAPDNGRHPTGRITITANGRTSASVMLDPQKPVQEIFYYVAGVGTNAVTLDYSGDENFLPSQQSWSIIGVRGNVTVTETASHNGTAATLRVTVAGSPMASPTGTIRVKGVQATLVSTSAGVAQAEVPLPNLTGDANTLLIEYSGDEHYLPSTQSTRLIRPRRPAVRH